MNLSSLSPSIISEYLEFANCIADEARNIALNYFRSSVDVSVKPDSTLVTTTDFEIERMARSMVADRFPDHGFIGEEYDDHATEQSWIWALDPIDGTEAFVYGLPTFGVLLSLTYVGQPVVGIIEMPALGERWCGTTRHRATWQGVPCQANANSTLAEAIAFATTIDMFNEEEKTIFDAVSKAARSRRFGIDCYAYGLLASGYVDVIMEADMKRGDIMALIPVVEGANGVISDWQGKPLTLDTNGQVLAASNRILHGECLAEIRKVCDR